MGGSGHAGETLKMAKLDLDFPDSHKDGKKITLEYTSDQVTFLSPPPFSPPLSPCCASRLPRPLHLHTCFCVQGAATGTPASRKSCTFEFDRVFTPDSSQELVFEEISQLVQGALDGYNVCIFAYGQVGLKCTTCTVLHVTLDTFPHLHSPE